MAGGYAKRMGQDIGMFNKGNLPLFDGQQDILSRSHAMLTELCNKVWIACRKDQFHNKYACVHDLYLDIGPISGIHTSLLHAKNSNITNILTIACDMPSITQELLYKLIEQHTINKSLMTTFKHIPKQHQTSLHDQQQHKYNSAEKKLHCLCAIYNISALSYFIKAIEAKQYALKNVIPQSKQGYVYCDFENTNAFCNLNTPEDLLNFYCKE